MDTQQDGTTETPTDGEQTTPATTVDATGTNGGQAQGRMFTQAEMDAAIAARLKRAQDKATADAQAAQKAAAQKAAEEQGEFKKLYEQTLAEKQAAEERARAIELATMRERIARTVGLPEALAARLQGEDEESITADAKALHKILPAPTAPNINSGPGAGAAPIPGQMTEAEKKEFAARYGLNPRYIGI